MRLSADFFARSRHSRRVPQRALVDRNAEPRMRTNERELAINEGFAVVAFPMLVHEWSGEPFQFYWGGPIPEDLWGHVENVFAVVERPQDSLPGIPGVSNGWLLSHLSSPPPENQCREADDCDRHK